MLGGLVCSLRLWACWKNDSAVWRMCVVEVLLGGGERLCCQELLLLDLRNLLWIQLWDLGCIEGFGGLTCLRRLKVFAVIVGGRD